MADLPLLHRQIVVTRAAEQADAFGERLRALGATPIFFPMICLAPMPDTSALDRAVRSLQEYDGVVFTSENGVRFFWDRLEALGLGAEGFAGLHVAAIGPATAKALAAKGIEADFIPDEHVAEAVADGLADMDGRRLLLPLAEGARAVLRERLVERGAIVVEIPTYRTLRPEPPAEALAALRAGVDAVTFTASSTVRHFLETLGDEGRDVLSHTLVACIGPITARTAERLGLRVGLVAEEYTLDGLTGALARHFSRERVGV